MTQCSDNAFSPATDTFPQRSYSQNINDNSSPEAKPYTGDWSGVLTSVASEDEMNITVTNTNGTELLINFGNGVLHPASIVNDHAMLRLTGTSWKNAVEECPPTAALFATFIFRLQESKSEMIIENTISGSRTSYNDLFVR